MSFAPAFPYTANILIRVVKMRVERSLSALAGLFFVILFSFAPFGSAAGSALPDRVKGSPSAPITLIEYSSFTCSHCAGFFKTVLPEIEKRYIDTGKVRFIYRDLPTDGAALKAAALARCMPENQFFSFVSILYKNQFSWLRSMKRDEALQQYAQMAGLPPEKAKTCAEDPKLLDALIAMRTEAVEKYGIQATPTFIINNGEDKILGAQDFEVFAAAFDKILAKKK